MEHKETSEERLKKFKEKVEKVTFMRDIGMLTEEELEKLKLELLNDIDKE